MFMMWAQIFAAIYLIGMGTTTRVTAGGLTGALLFKFFPVILGIPLAFGALANWMGWPV